jgi:hypothetical protein
MHLRWTAISHLFAILGIGDSCTNEWDWNYRTQTLGVLLRPSYLHFSALVFRPQTVVEPDSRPGQIPNRLLQLGTTKLRIFTTEKALARAAHLHRFYFQELVGVLFAKLSEVQVNRGYRCTSISLQSYNQN